MKCVHIQIIGSVHYIEKSRRLANATHFDVCSETDETGQVDVRSSFTNWGRQKSVQQRRWHGPTTRKDARVNRRDYRGLASGNAPDLHSCPNCEVKVIIACENEFNEYWKTDFRWFQVCPFEIVYPRFSKVGSKMCFMVLKLKEIYAAWKKACVGLHFLKCVFTFWAKYVFGAKFRKLMKEIVVIMSFFV